MRRPRDWSRKKYIAKKRDKHEKIFVYKKIRKNFPKIQSIINKIVEENKRYISLKYPKVFSDKNFFVNLF